MPVTSLVRNRVLGMAAGCVLISGCGSPSEAKSYSGDPNSAAARAAASASSTAAGQKQEAAPDAAASAAGAAARSSKARRDRQEADQRDRQIPMPHPRRSP